MERIESRFVRRARVWVGASVLMSWILLLFALFHVSPISPISPAKPISMLITTGVAALILLPFVIDDSIRAGKGASWRGTAVLVVAILSPIIAYGIAGLS